MKFLCLVMAGGKGSRLGGLAKPCIELCGKPMVLHVINILRFVCRYIVLAVSRYTKTCVSYICKDIGVECVETSGYNYVEDLSILLSSLRKPVLVVPCDTPFVSLDQIRHLISEGMRSRASVITAISRGRVVGIALFLDEKGSWVDVEIGDVLNVNTPRDLQIAYALCRERSL